jgi:hypothetical protein
MKNTKKLLNKSLFEATYIASDSQEIKKLKDTGVLQKDDVVKVVDQQQTSISEESSEVEKDIDMYVEYLSDMKDEKPFTVHGDKYEYVWARYSDGTRDIGVYKFAGDYTVSYEWFRKNILRQVAETRTITKDKLVETILNTTKPNIIKTLKKKDI